MKNITVKSAKNGNEFTGLWNEKTYKSYYSDDCVRIYVDNKEVNVLKSDLEAIASEEMKKDEERKKAQLTLERADEFSKAIKIVLDIRYLNAYRKTCSDETSELLKEVFANFNAELQKSYLRGFLLEF
jgi:hypothetical protein